MVFENKAKSVSYALYGGTRQGIEKRLNIDVSLAVEFNKIIAVYNSETKQHINNSMLSNLAFKCFINQLNKLSEDKALNYLKKEFKENTKETSKQATLIN